MESEILIVSLQLVLGLIRPTVGVAQLVAVEDLVRDRGTGRRADSRRLRQLDERVRPSVDGALLVSAPDPARSSQVHPGLSRQRVRRARRVGSGETGAGERLSVAACWTDIAIR